MDLLIRHSHLIVLVNISDGVFAESGLLRRQGVGSIDVCKDTVADHLVVHRHIHNLITGIRFEGHQHRVTLHKGVLHRVVTDDQRVANHRVTQTHGLTVATGYDSNLIFTTHNLGELTSPALIFHVRCACTFGNLQHSLFRDALEHAEVYLERLLEFHLHPLQTVTTFEGCLLYRFETLRQIHLWKHLTALKGRLANLLQTL